MSRAKRPPSPLVEATQAFDDALHDYTQLAEMFLRTPLAGAKQLERLNEILQEIAAAEQRLGAAGQTLAEKVSESRERQQALGQQMIDRLPLLKQRMEQLRDLHARFEALGEAAGGLNKDVAAASDSRDRAVRTELAGRMRALVERASELARDARALDFEELGNRAHALSQQLHSATRKLETAAL